MAPEAGCEAGDLLGYLPSGDAGLDVDAGGFALGALVSIAIAGVPWRPRKRLPLPIQLYGMGGLAVVLVALIAWRTAVL